LIIKAIDTWVQWILTIPNFATRFLASCTPTSATLWHK